MGLNKEELRGEIDKYQLNNKNELEILKQIRM